MLRDLWHARPLLWALPVRQYQIRYRQSTVGVVWAFAVLRRAAQLNRMELGDDAVGRLITDVTIQARDLRLLGGYGPDGRRVALPVTTMRATPGLHRKLAYAWALTFPSRSFLGARGDTSRDRLRRLARSTGWALRGRPS